MCVVILLSFDDFKHFCLIDLLCYFDTCKKHENVNPLFLSPYVVFRTRCCFSVVDFISLFYCYGRRTDRLFAGQLIDNMQLFLAKEKHCARTSENISVNRNTTISF